MATTQGRKEMSGTGSAPGLSRSVAGPPSLQTQHREHQHALVRVVVGTLFWGYGAFAVSRLEGGFPASLYAAAVVWLAVTTVLLITAKPARRRAWWWQSAGTLLDAGCVTYLSIESGKWGPSLFLLYTLIAADTGARFGARALIVSILAGAAGYAANLAMAPDWVQQWPLFAGVGVALATLPPFIYFLVRSNAIPRKVATVDEAANGVYQGAIVSLHRAAQNADLVANNTKLGAEDRRRLDAVRDQAWSAIERIESIRSESVGADGPGTAQQWESFDVVAMIRELVQGGAAGACTATDAPRIRIDPQLPHRLAGNRRAMADLLHALLFGKAVEPERLMLHVEPVHPEGHFHIRLGRRERVVRSHEEPWQDVWPDLLESLARPVKGRVERHGLEGEWLVTAVTVPAEASDESVTALSPARSPLLDPIGEEDGVSGDLGRGRVLLVTESQECEARIEEVARTLETGISVTGNTGEAVNRLAQGVRTGAPFHVVLVDADIAFGEYSERVGADLCEKARAVNTPVYVLGGNAATRRTLISLGYDGAIAEPSVALVARAVRGSPQSYLGGLRTGVVQVEPWAWRRRAPGKGRRILVVDDSKTNLLIVQIILKAAGYEVDAMRSAREALDRLLTEDYRLAILDLHMPDMDGLELLREYSRVRPRRRIPIVFLTANKSKDATLECADAGADAFLTKPVTRDELLGTVESLLKEREVHRLDAPDRSDAERESADDAVPLLNVNTVQELVKLYRDPGDSVEFVKLFRAEAEVLFGRMESAVAEGNIQEFADQAHALRAVTINLGGEALAGACHNAESLEFLEFRRTGRQVLAHLWWLFEGTVAALEREVLTNAP